VVSDWFSEPDARVESIAFNDGVTLLEQDVLQLVQQRAGFAAQDWINSNANNRFGGMEEMHSLPAFAAMHEGDNSGFAHRYVP
jgi:hypothetical protein